MSTLQTSVTLIRHSLQILARHPRLLLFPLIGALALAVAAGLLFEPRDEQPMSWSWMLQAAFGSRAEQDAAFAAMHSGPKDSGAERALSFPALASCYLLGMFVVTYVNAGLYSQIIAAMNGGRVSVRAGLATAGSKLPAIALWSMFAGTVGLALRALQNRIPLPLRWIATLTGLSWSAVSVFAIPVMLHEPATRSPLDYLRISAALLRRVWGAGTIGAGGFWLAGAMLVIPLLLGGTLIAFASLHFLPMFLGLLASALIILLLYLAWQVFACALYVYATQGVVPGSFDEATLARVWTVRR